MLSKALTWLLVASSCLYAKTMEERQSNHIFNTIHSSMRQWGSSIHHNGVSFFIATVPPDTHFYHGTAQKEPITGIEWLAFEPEQGRAFAQLFAQRPDLGKKVEGSHPSQSPSMILNRHQRVFQDHQHADKSIKGYLHTYKTKHQLRLLYLDGMSAGKSDVGTMDTQDYLLAYSLNLRNGTPFQDRARANYLCERAKNDWKNRIDGFIRMEFGFEIILCSFQDHLEVVRISAVDVELGPKEPDDIPVKLQITDKLFMSFYQAVIARYHGIGGNRVSLNYDDFVTGYTSEEDLFRDGSLPRLKGISKSTRHSIDAAVTRMVMSQKKYGGRDWQAVTDMIVNHFAPRLTYLASSAATLSSHDLVDQLSETIAPFIDYSNRDAKQEISRCTAEYLPHHWSSTTAGRAVKRVSERICSTLITLFYEQSQPGKANATSFLETINDLKDWLGWSVWKRCKRCQNDEVCVVPMWPLGGKDDWRHPSCANITSLREHVGYWPIESRHLTLD